MRITGDIEYVRVGDTVDAAGTKFQSNSVLAIGIQTRFTFQVTMRSCRTKIDTGR